VYAWIITHDIIGTDSLGTMGPGGISDKTKAKLKAIADGGKLPEDGDRFKLYDDDGEHYYSGAIIGDFDGFEPNDDFGVGSGCTEVKIRDKKTQCWETL